VVSVAADRPPGAAVATSRCRRGAQALHVKSVVAVPCMAGGRGSRGVAGGPRGVPRLAHRANDHPAATGMDRQLGSALCNRVWGCATVFVLGQQRVLVVAFKSTNPRRLNVYRLNDLMTARSWHLNALQQPAALHFCFTAQHKQVLPTLLSDLKGSEWCCCSSWVVAGCCLRWWWSGGAAGQQGLCSWPTVVGGPP
jgi:hypothetical protein